MKTLIHNIGQILHIENRGRAVKRGRELGHFPVTEQAWLLIDAGKIAGFGSEKEGRPETTPDAEIDARGGLLLPAYTDSHTHLVYAGTREDEFAQRLHGLSYAEIAAKGGGILNSARKLRQASEEELYHSAAQRLEEVICLGTGAIEIKSGYGLTPESEMKMLRVARQLGRDYPLPVKTTFLGAHALPENFKNDRQGYLQQITGEMLPALAEEKLADYVDVFCEEGYFNLEEMLQILEASKQYGLKAKLHLNQFNSLGAIAKAVEYDALSVDHLEVMEAADLKALEASDTIATLLPGCSFFLEIPYAPARELMRRNSIVALATDYNPGSAPSGNMNLIISLACIKMKMTPEEAISAATLNAAAAIELSHRLGSIEVGKDANLILTRPLHSASFMPYNFGHHHIARVLINGKTICSN